ncbi:MAG: hypothetical protein DMG07_26790 [Acidobacteria bacterium]|nr:MAG: hypothetical protein DMG07_26790 [Acidobacteriota bacterium]
MKVLGYSERGAMNALLFEISHCQHSGQLLERLLARAVFPFCVPPAGSIESATVLVEQSLSDFGNADAILLLERPVGKMAVFVEAKVKASQVVRWTIADEFAVFQRGLAAKVSSSNLFTQLYHKIRFVHAACGEGRQLHDGVRFPPCSTKSVRRIGSNPVVLRALEMVTPYLQDVFYLAIVPEDAANLDRFVRDTLKGFAPVDFEAWDVMRWGFLPWSEVKAFCTMEGLHRAREVLEFNEGQIC